MSRVGKKPIIIPNGVEVILDGNTVTVKGPKGTLTRTIHPLVQIHMNDGEAGKEVHIQVTNETEKNERAQWGTARSLIANMVEGVIEGFTKQLEVNGVGYRVKLSGKTVVLGVGYSHEVPFALPEGVEAQVEDNVITLTGANKQMVGEVAANIRKIRKPEPYKGKGIKYMDEVIRRKAGKAQKAGE
jgi:large subunit ribosomal protein L6